MLLVFVSLAAAQDDAQCQAVTESAFASISETCRDLPRDSLCYASGSVEADFASAVAFDSEGDTAPLTQLTRAATAGFDLDDGSFGVAVMRASANQPYNESDPGLLFLLAGDAALIHDVDRAQVAEIREPLHSAALAETTVYAHPSIVAEVVGQLDADLIALVDAQDETGEWLRLVNDGLMGWAQRENLARLSAFQRLPILEAGQPFAMRDFSFSASLDYPECDAAAPVLAIQTPADLTVDLRMNGADIQFSGLLSASQAQRNALSLNLHRGSLRTSSGQVEAGSSVIAILDGGGRILAFSGAVPASDAELARGEALQHALNALLSEHGWAINSSEMRRSRTTHIVKRGDSLFGLARRYDTSVAEILRANGHSGLFKLVPDMEIVIPYEGSGFSGLGATSGGVTAAASSSDRDCAGLRLTDPLYRAPGGMARYYWDGAAAATGYRVDVYDHASGALVGSFHTAAGVTSVSFSAGQLGVGGALQWEVTALADGQAICSTGKSSPMPHVPS